MNKYEKAIRYFEEHLAVLENHCKHGGDFALEARDHTRTAIEALRKQVGKVARCINRYDLGLCPNCGYQADIYHNYCLNCGQALDPDTAECIKTHCIECPLHSVDGEVCDQYADKVDEIRRIHEEATWR